MSDGPAFFRVVEKGSDSYERTRALCETRQQAEDEKQRLKRQTIPFGGSHIEIEGVPDDE